MYSKQKSLNFGQYVPNDKVLNKKVPENPKYKHVKPAIDTGKTVRKHIDDLKEKQKNCHHKKDEVFKRIKLSTFIKLAIAVATDLLSDENDTANMQCSYECILQLCGLATTCSRQTTFILPDVNPNSSTDKPKAVDSIDRRSVANVLMGIGELDIVNDKKKVHSAPIMPDRQMPYLLLDVRDRDAFSQCHIITARHYPSAMLSRSIGYEIEDLKLFKNRPYGLIILYDDDETTAARVATTLVERGYDNIYLLSGGLKLALDICPQGLATYSQKLTSLHTPLQGATSQRCASKEYFSQEDIDTIKCFIEAYPSKSNKQVWSSLSSQSRRDKSFESSYRHNTVDNRSVPSRASSTSGRESVCSSLGTEQMHLMSANSKNSRVTHIRSNCSKSMEQMHNKPIDDKLKRLKKAPWK